MDRPIRPVSCWTRPWSQQHDVASLRSSDIPTLVVQHTSTRFVDRCFRCAAALIWNRLPMSLRVPGVTSPTGSSVGSGTVSSSFELRLRRTVTLYSTFLPSLSLAQRSGAHCQTSSATHRYRLTVSVASLKHSCL